MFFISRSFWNALSLGNGEIFSILHAKAKFLFQLWKVENLLFVLFFVPLKLESFWVF